MSDVFDMADNQSESTDAKNSQIESAKGRKIHDRLKDTMYYI